MSEKWQFGDSLNPSYSYRELKFKKNSVIEDDCYHENVLNTIINLITSLPKSFINTDKIALFLTPYGRHCRTILFHNNYIDIICGCNSLHSFVFAQRNNRMRGDMCSCCLFTIHKHARTILSSLNPDRNIFSSMKVQ
jgi:hypothetical protein